MDPVAPAGIPSEPAATRLLGLTVDGDWTVIKAVQKKPGGTGGQFSKGYIVEHSDGRRGYLKAIDLWRAQKAPDFLNELHALLADYNHEKEVLEHCQHSRLRNVVVAVAAGTLDVPGYPPVLSTVPYLIFELADGDARGQIDAKSRYDALWSLRALKDVAIALRQCHGEMIAHQDAKPSNVMVYKGRPCHLGDFGRASMKGRSPRHDSYKVAGDLTYAPPEQLYGQIDPDFASRRFACDLYLFGSLMCFFLTGQSMTPLVLSKLDPSLHWQRWGGRYADVLPYVRAAFAEALQEIEGEIDPLVRREAAEMIAQLCEPDPAGRGHPRDRIGKSQPYSLERYLSRLDLMARHLEIDRRVAAKRTAS